LATKQEKRSLPQLEQVRQWSVDDCWLCIMLNHRAKWPLWSINIVLTAFVCQNAQEYVVVISNNSNFRQKHMGVPDGSDGCDGTSYPLTENYTLPVAQATGRVAHVLLYFVVTFTHHQKDTCVKLFTGAAVMLKPCTQCLAMLNHSYYLSFNNFQNLCIQFVFSSMYLCIYIANMYSPSLSPPPLPQYLRTPAIAHSRCTWRPWSSELRDALGGRDWVNSVIHCEAVIERVQRCTWRPKSSELRDTLRGRDQASLEMQLEAVIERVSRCTLRP